MSADPAAAQEARRGSSGAPSVARGASTIAVATLLARIAGFARILVFAHSVGAAGVGDVYQTVNTVPNVLFEIAAGGVLAAVAVPIIGGQLGRGLREDADRTASALLGWALVVLTPLAVVLAVAAPLLSQALLTDKALPAEVDLGTRMLVVFAPQVVLYGIGIVLTGILQSHRRFLAAAIAPLLSSLVVMASYILYGQMTEPGTSVEQVDAAAVAVLAGGTTLGVVVMSLPLLVPTMRAGVRLRPTLRFPDGVTARARVLAGAGLTALVAQQLAVLTTLWLAHNSSSSGTIVVYQYVQAVYLLPYAVLAVPVATSAFPALAHAEGGEAGQQSTLSRALQGIVVLMGLAVAVLVAVAAPVGSFFAALDRSQGSGGGPALDALPDALLAYAPGLVGFGAAALLTRALYVRGRPSHAALAVAGGWLVAALWPLLTLPKDAGPTGTLRSLGVACSVGMSLSAVALAVLVRRSWGPAALRGTGRTLGAAVVAAALAAGVGDAAAFYWSSEGLAGAVAVGTGVAVLVAAVYLAVMMVADRSAMRSAVQRGRQRRGRSA
jgi:putative peptidoglycan lipid II flippase